MKPFHSKLNTAAGYGATDVHIQLEITKSTA